MIFNSFQFVWLFPVIFVIYWMLTGRNTKSNSFSQLSNAFLIVVSYALYIQWKPVYALVLLGVTAVTYIGARIIEVKNAYGKQKYLLSIALCLAALPLLAFKYYDFVSGQLNVLLDTLSVEWSLPGLNLALPLGISFFTLQAISYLYDVYKQKIPAEHNWWHYMLFVSFFPQIASGPISKASELLPQIKSQRHFDYSQAVQGLKWLLWGMFLKVVVADSIGLQVDVIYQSYSSHSGLALLITSIYYIIQIYCDFAGYSYMALGVGQTMGFELINNFQRPYFSVSVTEFWRRWHISLSRWLKDYIFIPLGGSRCGKLRNYLNIIITFVISGIWHGANWTFIIWGLIHGAVQVFEKMFDCRTYEGHNHLVRILRIVTTFMVFDLSMIFFRMPSLDDAINVYGKLFTDFTFEPFVWTYCSMLVLIVFFKDLMDELDIKQLRLLHSKYTIVRWITYVVLISFIAISGVYGGQFIYSGF
ncbi:MAG: MBOAT family protein [Bacteroidaceae bacterium]|nr:MBOAT family protein [Bacteroidaceae bacterium]